MFLIFLLWTDPINTNFRGVAVKGTDVVAYFTQSQVVAGQKQFSVEWQGAKWYFSSAKNKELFTADPEKYAPQFGGYCAWAVSQGYTAGIDPEAWAIVEGKLYLNYSQSVKEKWSADQAALIKAAETNWPQILAK